MKNVRAHAMLAVCGASLGLASLANAQGYVVNISGATLLENYVKSEASTNDFIDVDGDGIAGSLGSLFPDQLALTGAGPAFPAGQRWVVQYRVTGSVNGFRELVSFGGPSFVTTDANDALGLLGAAQFTGGTNPGNATTAYHNRTLYISTTPNAGVRTGAYNQGNPGGAPNRSDLASLIATYAAPDSPATGGIRIDIAPLDVASNWAVRKTVGTPAFNRTPFENGYGNNPLTGKTKQGASAVGQNPNQLADLGPRNIYNPLTPGVHDSNTIFDQELAFAAIAPVINYGTGLTQTTITQLQHLFITGRANTGENFIVATRDAGSGTRNAFMNCIGVDPAYGRGDNIGVISTSGGQNNLSAAFQASHKGSNGGMESVLRNARLGVGYVGTERGVTGSGSGSWLVSDALEILPVQNDIYGGTAFVRPTTTNILNNDANGWVIGGQAVLATIGDPRAELVSAGGDGLSTPQMPNEHAAAYMNNIRQSIAAFISVPGGAESTFMPGEYAATQFILLPALDNLHSTITPTTLISNSSFSGSLQSYILSNNVHNNAEFIAFNNAPAGRVPTRTTGVVYSDGVANGANYLNQAGGNVSYAGVLTLRNKIAGDFDGNGLRNTSDATNMVRAWSQRNGGGAWAAPVGTGIIAGAPATDAIIEVLGDFDGNGSFNKFDVRYWADGLAMVGGSLNRAAGFLAVDTASQAVLANGNFFGTTLATPKAYAAGDSRGDVSNASGQTTPGWAPIGSDRNNGSVDADDNRINASDIDYVYKQFKQNPAVTDGAATWSNLTEAVGFDLSADMTGDLVVNQDDVNDLVLNILGTSYCDVNLDGVGDSADAAIVSANLGLAGGWAMGDVDGDGTITAADVTIVGCGPVCGSADFDGDGDTGTDLDIEAFFACLGGDCCATCGSVTGPASDS